MTDTDFYIEGLEGLETAMRDFPRMVNREMTTGMKQITEIVRGEFAEYPARRYGVKVTFTSPKQRRGFFAKLRSGEIEVPYRRGASPGSEKLGSSWVKEVRSTGATNVVGFVQTVVSYAGLVHGKLQTAMHKGTGWRTVDVMLKAIADTVITHFGGVIQKILARIAAGGVR
jgi:hypothetical protein